MNWLKFLLMSLCVALLFAACDSGSSSASSDGISTSVDQESPSSSVNQAFSSGSDTSEPAGIESSYSCVGNENVGSSADVPVSSEDVPLSSSEQSSSSVQETSSSLVDEFEWNDNRERIVQVIKRFNGDSSEIQKEGRVLVALDDTTNFNEFVDSLGALDLWLIDSLNCKRKNYDVYFVKFEKDIPKTTLAEIIPGFFNSFNVDDTTKIEVNIPSECLENGEIRSDSWMEYSCWPDVSKEDCSNVIDGCGRDLTKENVDCIASQKDILSFYVLCPVTTAD